MADMDVTIYSYRVWDHRNSTHVIPPRMATRQFITMARGDVIEASAKTVDETCIDENGQEILDPAKGR